MFQSSVCYVVKGCECQIVVTWSGSLF